MAYVEIKLSAEHIISGVVFSKEDLESEWLWRHLRSEMERAVDAEEDLATDEWDKIKWDDEWMIHSHRSLWHGVFTSHIPCEDDGITLGIHCAACDAKIPMDLSCAVEDIKEGKK
jgi:hypothetical protein